MSMRWVPLLWILGCAADTTVVAPDLDALVRAYEQPSGQLDGLLAGELFATVAPTLQSLSAVANQTFFTDALESARMGLVDLGVDPALDIDGHLDVHMICPGFEPDAEPDAERDGTLDLYVPVDNAHLGPVVFGPADRCKFDGVPTDASVAIPLPDSIQGVIDGEVAIHLGGPVGLTSTAPPKPLVRILGDVSFEALPTLHDVDFRVPEVGRLELRIPLKAGGEVIVFIERDAIGLREKRGDWSCSEANAPPCVEAFAEAAFSR